MQRCHTYKIAVSKYQGRCEQRSEVFVKIQKKLGGGGGGEGGLRLGGGGGQGGCDQRIEVFVKIQKKYIFFFLGGGREGSGWGVRVDVIKELEFLRKFKKKIGGGGRVGGGSGRAGGWGGEGSGWGGQGGCERRIEVFV